jgi:excisionase family DNA binding protein
MEHEMTVKEAAAYIGCDQSQVRRLCKSGRLQSRRIGDRVLVVTRPSVEEYKASAQHGGWPRGKTRKPAE